MLSQFGFGSQLRSLEARALWAILVIAGGAVFSVTFACIVPLATMAWLASRTTSTRTAIVALFGAVAANQIVGFTVLSYPHTLATLIWAPFFVIATLGAYLAARAVAQPIVAAVGAFVAYEAIMAVFSFATEHSLAAFSPAIVGEVALANLVGVAVLGPVYAIVVLLERLVSARLHPAGES